MQLIVRLYCVALLVKSHRVATSVVSLKCRAAAVRCCFLARLQSIVVSGAGGQERSECASS